MFTKAFNIGYDEPKDRDLYQDKINILVLSAVKQGIKVKRRAIQGDEYYAVYCDEDTIKKLIESMADEKYGYKQMRFLQRWEFDKYSEVVEK